MSGPSAFLPFESWSGIDFENGMPLAADCRRRCKPPLVAAVAQPGTAAACAHLTSGAFNRGIEPCKSPHDSANYFPSMWTQYPADRGLK